MYKRLVCVFLAAMTVAMTGCAGFQIADDLKTELMVKNGARGLGYAVARIDNPILQKAVEQAYLLLRKGEFSESDLTALIKEFDTAGEKLIAYAALDLLTLMGAMIEEGTILDLSGIPDRLWDVAELAYLQGYDMGLVDRAVETVNRVLP